MRECRVAPLLLCLLFIPVAVLAEQSSSFQPGEAGRILLEEGVESWRDALDEAGVPALTFNQETQVRTVRDSHFRVLSGLLEENGGNRAAIEPEIRALEEQLLLAALKFLNPAQRSGLIGSAASAELAELNSDLPEDEAELLEYLTDLRSPAGTESTSTQSSSSSGFGGGGGGGGGGLIIDGFSGGRMPNRDEIQEIRINENSFTAEQSNQTRGRTEVITRGGAGRFNGDFTFNFRDESLDARNAFAAARPPYQQRNFIANVSGPIIRNRLTMTFSLRNNNSETGETLRALTPDGLVDDAVVRPTVQRGYTTRGTLQLSENNNLNMSYEFGTQNSSNQNVGEFGLPEQASLNNRDNFTFQVKETAVLSARFNNEARFQYSGNFIQQQRVNDAPHINVLGAFRAGGAPGNRDTKLRSYDFGNLLMYTGDSWAFRFGYDGGFTRINSDTQNNFNGTFTFNSLYDYCGIALGEFTASQCQIELAENPGVPLTGPTYSISTGIPLFIINQWQSAMYVQSDWRATSRLTLSLGARYEWQTNLEDGNNLDPRLGFAYQIGSNTVLRGGTGTFHQRLAFFAALDLLRNDGTNQQTFEISEVVPFIDFSVNPLQGGGDDEFLVPTSRRVRAPELTAPYTWNNELSIETSFSGGLILTGSYRFIRGLHLFRDRNLNAPLDFLSLVPRSCQAGQNPATCFRPDPTEGNVNQHESTGTSSSHTFRIGVRQRFSFMNLNGSYDFDSTYDDLASGGGGNFSGSSIRLPADNYDLDSEWGRSGARHRMNVSANIRLPWDINANTIFNWNSGSPYTHQTGSDDNLDTTRNDRPAGVPKNSLTGPGFFETGFDFSKAIQLRSDQGELAGPNGASVQGPVGTGGYYGQRTGLRMTIRAQVTNLLNNVNHQSFSGVETSRFFMLPTRARNPRQITLSARFDF
jgi:hypothetical protein